MSNELVKTNTNVSTIGEIESMQKLCGMLMKTKHYAKMGEEGIFAIVAKAKSLAIDPLDALNGGLYFVQGKVGMASEMMASLIRQKGHSIVKDQKSDNSICILHGTRKDNGDTWTVSFSMEDAKRASLIRNGGTYEKYPSVMLYNRAMSLLARQLFPDVIKGAGYTMDELREIAKLDSKIDVVEEECEEIIETISDEQATELSEILSECDVKYQQSVWETLKSNKLGIHTLDKIPMTLYDRIKSAAVRNRDQYKEFIEKEKSKENKNAEANE